MTKVFKNVDLVKELSELDDTTKVIGGFGHYLGFTLKTHKKTKEKYYNLKFDMSITYDNKDFVTSIGDFPIPFIIMAKKDTIKEIVNKISYEKEEDK